MNKRKIMALALSLCMIAILAVGGTLAYFSDSDADVNVMTVGNLDIEQIEDFDETDILAPGGDPVTKKVDVKNNGTVPAYVRTLIAVEDTRDVSAGVHLISGQFPNITFPGSNNNYLQVQDKDGVVYTVGVVTYEKAVNAGETVEYMLSSVQVKAEADNAWREIVGDKYNVIVLTQGANAVATETAEEVLNAAFGVIDENADEAVAGWLNNAIEGQNFRAFDYSEYTAEGSGWGPMWTGEAYTNPTSNEVSGEAAAEYTNAYTGDSTTAD